MREELHAGDASWCFPQLKLFTFHFSLFTFHFLYQNVRSMICHEGMQIRGTGGNDCGLLL